MKAAAVGRAGDSDGEASASGDGARGARLDVLLVEDDAALAEMYRIRLTVDGHCVRITTDGPSGLAEALDRPPQVALLDLGLPGFDGLELLERLRRDVRGARVPVIVLSNYSDPELIRRGAELGALAYLIKSQTTPATLVETMCDLLSGRPAGFAGT